MWNTMTATYITKSRNYLLYKIEPVVAATIADAASASTAAVAGIIEKNDLLENAVQ